jgi:cytochrome c oxidase subunit IV
VSYLFAWLALMGLLCATAASSFIALGEWNTIINFAISCGKALVVALVYMELGRSSLRPRLAAAIALFTLALLFGLSWTDFATRDPGDAPWAVRP